MLEKGNHEVTVALPSDREIVLTRSFARPRGLLFEGMDAARTRPAVVGLRWIDGYPLRDGLTAWRDMAAENAPGGRERTFLPRSVSRDRPE